MLNNINKSIPIFTLTFVSVLLLFNRPFVGIYIFGIRLGELIIAGSLFLAVVIPAIFLFSKTLKINKEYRFLTIIYGIIGIFFLASILYHQTSIFSTYTYKTSSYIWSLGFLMLGIYSTKINFNKFYIAIFSATLFVIYLVAIFDFPNFIQSIFLNYSDKYGPHKAADIVLFLVIYLTYLNNYFKKSLTSLTVNLFVFSLFLPLLLEVQ